MKRFFLGGLTALLPTVLTLWVVVALVAFVGNYVASPVTQAIHWVLSTNRLGKSILESTTPVRIYDPAHLDTKARAPGANSAEILASADESDAFFLDLSMLDHSALDASLDSCIPPVFGLAVGLVLIFVAGFLLRGYFGKWLLRRAEKLFFSIPFVRRIYPYAKKIVDFLFDEGSKADEFESVVAVPYPSPDRYTVGFVTSEGLATINERTGDDYIGVFLPCSPAPMTGYLVYVRRCEVIPLSMTLDQTMGLLISGGVIVPDAELCEGSLAGPGPGAPEDRSVAAARLDDGCPARAAEPSS